MFQVKAFMGDPQTRHVRRTWRIVVGSERDAERVVASFKDEPDYIDCIVYKHVGERLMVVA